jgi:hypothetical protein
MRRPDESLIVIAQNRPRDGPEMLPAELSLDRRGDILGIELVAGPRIGAKLRPKLLDRDAIADPVPEVAKFHWNGTRYAAPD